jgi:hypothetical protein
VEVEVALSGQAVPPGAYAGVGRQTLARSSGNGGT